MLTQKNYEENHSFYSSSSLFFELLELSQDLIFVYDLEGRFVYVGESAAKYFNCDVQDMVGKKWKDLLLPSEMMMPYDRIRQEVQKHGMAVQGFSPFAMTNSVCFHEYRFKPLLHSETQAMEGVLVIIRDITDQKTTKENKNVIQHLLSHYVSVCNGCQKIHDPGSNKWVSPETYLFRHKELSSHNGLCSQCVEKRYQNYQMVLQG